MCAVTVCVRYSRARSRARSQNLILPKERALPQSLRMDVVGAVGASASGARVRRARVAATQRYIVRRERGSRETDEDESARATGATGSVQGAAAVAAEARVQSVRARVCASTTRRVGEGCVLPETDDGRRAGGREQSGAASGVYGSAQNSRLGDRTINVRVRAAQHADSVEGGNDQVCAKRRVCRRRG